jgi:branched-chain amino acid transport system ATP-binding protein
MKMLEVKDLHVNYGAIKAVRGITFNVDEGEIVTLIGSNGAGKTTTLRAISGLEKVKSGQIIFKNENITNQAPYLIVKKGITHVPEGRRIFTNLSILNNLRIGANIRHDTEGIKADLKAVFRLFPRLEERKNQSASTISGGEQQMLAIGRAMMTGGQLILLDEPSMGLAPMIVEEIFRTIKAMNDQGKTILLVEQNAFMALKLANRAYVLETGNISIEGDARQLLKDERVKAAYLGE